MKPLAPSKIRRRLARLPGWRYSSSKKALVAEYRLKDFTSAVRVIGRIAKIAEALNHHPDLHLTRYRRLKIVLTTHDAGGVTGSDFKLASRILSLF